MTSLITVDDQRKPKGKQSRVCYAAERNRSHISRTRFHRTTGNQVNQKAPGLSYSPELRDNEFIRFGEIIDKMFGE